MKDKRSQDESATGEMELPSTEMGKTVQGVGLP